MNNLLDLYLNNGLHLIIGSAGSGKTTFCKRIIDYINDNKKVLFLDNGISNCNYSYVNSFEQMNILINKYKYEHVIIDQDILYKMIHYNPDQTLSDNLEIFLDIKRDAKHINLSRFEITKQKHNLFNKLSHLHYENNTLKSIIVCDNIRVNKKTNPILCIRGNEVFVSSTVTHINNYKYNVGGECTLVKNRYGDINKTYKWY